MGDMRIGDVVRSTAGRDAGDPYVVVGVSEERVLLSEGGRRSLRRPKSKNPRHVVRVGRIDEFLASRIECRRSRDEDIAEFIAVFHRQTGDRNREHICVTECAGIPRDGEGAGQADG